MRRIRLTEALAFALAVPPEHLLRNRNALTASLTEE